MIIAASRIYIDAYNVLHTMPQLSRLLKSNADAARRGLVSIVAAARRKGTALVLVFDSFGEPIAAGNGVTVVFSATMTADAWIRAQLEREAKLRNTLVVSSDREVASHASAMGAAVMRAEDFLGARVRVGTAGEDAKPERRLSKSEIDEWLSLFSGDRS